MCVDVKLHWHFLSHVLPLYPDLLSSGNLGGDEHSGNQGMMELTSPQRSHFHPKNRM
jgi:hypothetical protein